MPFARRCIVSAVIAEMKSFASGTHLSHYLGCDGDRESGPRYNLVKERKAVYSRKSESLREVVARK